MRLAVLLPLLSLLSLGGCLPDDFDGYDSDTDADTLVVDTDTDVDTDDDSSASSSALVGSWRSEGNDLSALFATPALDIARIDASFYANGSYEVLSVDGSGGTSTFTGSYAVGSGTPTSVDLVQSTPYTAESEGLFRVQSGVLTYEVVQTLPDYGNVPPSGAFGTSSGPGFAAGENVQTYRRIGQ